MYTFDSKVRYSETDEKGLLSIAGMVNYFQDTSTFQSEALGVGVAYLKSRGVAWVMNAWQIVVREYPALGETIRVGTLPYAFKGFMGLRNFWMEDGQGRQLAKANSVWTLLDMQKGVPVRVTPEVIEKYTLEERLEMTYAPRKIVLPAKQGRQETAFAVGRQHLDGNYHVNNGQYIHMAAGYLPADFVIGQMRAEYKKQAHLQDRIVPAVWEDKDRVLVALNGEDGNPYATVEFCGRMTEPVEGV